MTVEDRPGAMVGAVGKGGPIAGARDENRGRGAVGPEAANTEGGGCIEGFRVGLVVVEVFGMLLATPEAHVPNDRGVLTVEECCNGHLSPSVHEPMVPFQSGQATELFTMGTGVIEGIVMDDDDMDILAIHSSTVDGSFIVVFS